MCQGYSMGAKIAKKLREANLQCPAQSQGRDFHEDRCTPHTPRHRSHSSEVRHQLTPWAPLSAMCLSDPSGHANMQLARSVPDKFIQKALQHVTHPVQQRRACLPLHNSTFMDIDVLAGRSDTWAPLDLPSCPSGMQ